MNFVYIQVIFSLKGSDLIIVLFTNSYPYDFAAEHTFLERELPYLTKNFEKVILIPKISKGKLLTIPPAVEADDSLADYFRKNANFVSLAINALIFPHFYQELITNPYLLLQPFKLAKLILFSGRAKLVMKWFNGWMDTYQLRSEQILLYSYWFDDIALGLGLTKQQCPQLRLVSRAHGFDIYEEKYFPYYWPFRRESLTMLDKLFTASNDGRDYFRNRYPEFYDLFETAHLGIEDPGFISGASKDGVLRIISCAHILPLKRMDLLLDGIALAAKMRPEQEFSWHHFGDGKARKSIQKAVTAHFPPNAKGFFPGHVPNQEIMRHYRKNPVDVFVNLSTTEGGAPVSIQEAISYGIPIIATNVGGNPEIVSERNGILLSPNPIPEEVAQALLWICDNPEIARKMRKESRQVWEESYNAGVNFRAFAQRLKEIRQS